VEDLAFWRNIALVFLIIQFFVLVVVAVAVSYLLVRVTANLHLYAQRGADKAQEVSQVVVEKTDAYAEKARAPIVKGNATGAGILAGIRTLFSGDKSSADGTVHRDSQPVNLPGRES
jgi:hypothetical protein